MKTLALLAILSLSGCAALTPEEIAAFRADDCSGPKTCYKLNDNDRRDLAHWQAVTRAPETYGNEANE